MIVTGLRRVARNVVNLEDAAGFYADALGFETISPAIEDSMLAELLGVQRLRVLRMRLGAQEIELSECYPPGAPYEHDVGANDLSFQHIAIVTSDMTAAAEKVFAAGAKAISLHGPVTLPRSSGGVSALKFRDPEGHPLEILQFPAGGQKMPEGFDHSAISVSDVAQSVAFYAGIGVRKVASQLNQGPAQDSLDGLMNVNVAVVALQPQLPTPHVELLCYRTPRVRAGVMYAPSDICADRLVFATATATLQLLRDPDGHVVLIDGR